MKPSNLDSRHLVLVLMGNTDDRPYTLPTMDRSRQAQAILQELEDTPHDQNLNLHKLRRLRRDQERAENVKAARPVTIKDFNVFNCDFREVGNRIADGSVDLAVVDPPWAEWETLGRPLGRELRRILRPNGIACVYTGVYWEDKWNDALKSTGLKKAWRLIALHKLPLSLRPNGTIFHGYTSILLYRTDPEGDLPINRILRDVLDSPQVEKEWYHMQKPVSEAMQLIDCLSKPGQLICDLCSGSGTVAVATALVGGRRRFVGCEIDKSMVAAALTRVAEALQDTSSFGIVC